MHQVDVSMASLWDEAQSQSERLGEEERERREMSESQPGTSREEDRERESVCVMAGHHSIKLTCEWIKRYI